jgi:hypothetical protein
VKKAKRLAGSALQGINLSSRYHQFTEFDFISEHPIYTGPLAYHFANYRDFTLEVSLYDRH